MPVTEFAILRLRHGHHRPGLLDTLARCQQLQDGWMRCNQPGSLDPGVSISAMSLEQPGPDNGSAPSLLITAPWDSIQAHAQWLRCDENRACNDQLSEYLVSGGDSVLLFHMEPAGTRAQVRRGFVSQGDFNVCRIPVDSARQRDALREAYRALDEAMHPEVWAGWRLETDHDFVLFWTDNVSHERLRRIMSLSDAKFHYRFQRVA